MFNDLSHIYKTNDISAREYNNNKILNRTFFDWIIDLRHPWIKLQLSLTYLINSKPKTFWMDYINKGGIFGYTMNML